MQFERYVMTKKSKINQNLFSMKILKYSFDKKVSTFCLEFAKMLASYQPASYTEVLLNNIEKFYLFWAIFYYFIVS